MISSSFAAQVRPFSRLDKAGPVVWVLAVFAQKHVELHFSPTPSGRAPPSTGVAITPTLSRTAPVPRMIRYRVNRTINDLRFSISDFRLLQTFTTSLPWFDPSNSLFTARGVCSSPSTTSTRYLILPSTYQRPSAVIASAARLI